MEPRVGQVLHGYCGGYFGRDGFGPKRIEAFGEDWIVVRTEIGRPNMADFNSRKEMEECLDAWSLEKE